MTETFIRFMVGGLFVSAFAVLGDVLKPKSFAGLFGASPSVALATLTLTIHSPGTWFRRRGSTFDDFRRDRVFRLCLRRLPANHSLQADGVNSRERIDRD